MIVRFVVSFVYYSLSLVLSLFLIASIIVGDWHVLADYGFEIVALFWFIALLVYLKFIKAESRGRRVSYKSRLSGKIKR